MFRHNNNIYFSWLLSYMSILLIPLVAILISYMLSVSVIEKEINETHTASLQQLNQIMESTFSDIQNLAIEVSWNNKNKAIIRYPAENLSPVQRYNIFNFVKNLKTLKLANNNIDSIYIYYKHNNLVLSNNGMCKSDEYYDIYVKNSGMNYEDWIYMLNKSEQNNFIPYKIVNNMGQVENIIAYVRSLPFEKYTESDATLIILLDMNVIYNLLNQIDWINDCHIFIIDKNDTVIVSNQTGPLPEQISFNNLDGTEEAFHLTVDREEMLVSHIHSKTTGWKYVMMIPTKLYLQKARFIRTVMVCSILCCLLIGGILSWLFTNKNYKPISYIINTVGSIIGKTPSNKFITYRDIEATINTMIEKDQILENRLNTQNKILQKHFLNRLITGHINDADYIQSVFESYDIKLKSDLFAILLFYIEDYSTFYNNNEDQYNADESIELVRFIITNVVEELVNTKHHQGFMTEIENMLVCLINMENSDSNKEWINEITHTAQNFMKEKFGIIISVSISSIASGVENINKAYQEAIEAMEYKKLTIGEFPDVIDYDSINVDAFNKSIAIGEEEKFINCIKVGNYKQAKDIFNSIIKNNFYKPYDSAKLMKYRMFGLINMLINAVMEISMTLEDEFIDEIRPIERLLECEDIKQLQQEANNILESINSYTEEKRQQEDKENLKDTIIKFVQDNYTDMNLNVSSIAEHFGVSVSYISRYFKKHCGVNLLDYIHSVRIEKAKYLMRKGNYTVEQIAHMVGYYSSVSFIRSFKKYEKITPGQYMNR